MTERGIRTEQIKVFVRQTEYIGADETKFPVQGKDSESGTADTLACSTDPEQEQPFVVYECMQSRRGQIHCQSFKDLKFSVLTPDCYKGY